MYQYQLNSIFKEDWTCDQLPWTCSGSKTIKIKEFAMKKRYYVSRKSENFHKKAFIVTDETKTTVLVQYFGDPLADQQEMPHGNRKFNLLRKHVTTFPSTLKQIEKNCEKPKSLYRKMVNELTPSCDPIQMPAMLPKNSNQIRNKQKNTRHKGLIH